MTKTLTQISISKLNKPGFHRDGMTTGLYVQVTKAATTGKTSRNFVFRYTSPVTHAERYLGLGACDLVTLAEARDRVQEYRRQVRIERRDPLDERHQTIRLEIEAQAKRMTFADCVHDYLAQRGPTFSNPKHRQQWRSTLNKACEAFGKVLVGNVDTAMIVKLLTPICQRTPETGSRLRGRIETVLDWATVAGFRQGDNPARWDGHLEHALPRKTAAKQHHPAMPFVDVPRFCERLRERDSLSAKALEFTILTAARTGETLGATWSEIDLKAKVWTIPAERMKAKQEHQVPLSDRVVEILKGIERNGRDLVFPLSNMALTMCLRKAGGNGFTVHGMRSSFRDWAGERAAHFGRDVIEFALAHKLKDKVERAYYRSNQLEKRRKLMATWEQFCAMTGEDGRVVQFGVAS